MRFDSALLATLAVASIGVQALLPPDEPTRPAYASSALSPSDTATYKSSEPSIPVINTTSKPPPVVTHPPPPPDTQKPPPPQTPKPEATSTYKPEYPKPSDTPKQPEYGPICKQFAFLHNWDYDCGNLPSGPTQEKYIYECAEDCLENGDCDATVSFDGHCYLKTLDGFPPPKLVKKEGRDMAILGSCQDLQANYEKRKCYPDGFLDCCYDKYICTDVYKHGKDTKGW